jgi:hypothetical protein
MIQPKATSRIADYLVGDTAVQALFRRDAGLCDLLATEIGPVHAAIASTPDHERWAVLARFVNDRGLGRELMNSSPVVRSKKIVEFMTTSFGDEARNHVGFHEFDWASDD